MLPSLHERGVAASDLRVALQGVAEPPNDPRPEARLRLRLERTDLRPDTQRLREPESAERLESRPPRRHLVHADVVAESPVDLLTTDIATLHDCLLFGFFQPPSRQIATIATIPKASVAARKKRSSAKLLQNLTVLRMITSFPDLMF